MRSLPRLKTLLCAAGALGLATTAACGDDSGSDPDARPSADGRTIDADVADSAPADASISELRSGIIAVIDAKVTNDFGVALAGPSISISYTDLTTATTAPVFGTGTGMLNACDVYIYDADNPPPETVDEGAVSFTVDGTEVVLPPCAYTDGSYRCIADADAADTSVTILKATPEAGRATVAIGGASFPASAAGMWLNLSGIPEDDAPTSPNGTFQILGVAAPDGNTVVIPDSDALEGVTWVTADGGTPTYAVLQGVGPGPLPQDFLSKGVEITASKVAGDVVPALTGNTLTPSGVADPDAVDGDGDPAPIAEFSLNDTETVPHDFPTSSPDDDIVFSCAAPASCGAAGTGSAAVGFTIAGTATNADLTGLPPFAMPQGTKTAVFQCRGSVGGSSITIPKAAVDAILSIDPTRIETRVLRVTADLSAGTTHGTTVVVGKGLVGWTDVPQAN